MEPKKTRRQFGLWDSPVSALSLARNLKFADVAWDWDGSLVWLENRSGMGTLVVQPADGQAQRDVNAELSVRGRVGYGGGDFTVDHGQVFFVEADSGRIYRQSLAAGAALPITPAFGQAAAPKVSPDGRWLLFVHSYEGQDTLALVDGQGQFWPQKLAWGADFYMQPAWHADSQQIAWVEWDHPNMPWDGSRLCMARLKHQQGSLPAVEETFVIAGNENTAIFQPEFSPDGRSLVYVSDASGWWQLYVYELASGQHRQLTEIPAEHGLPAWIQGRRTYAFAPDGRGLYFLRNQAGSISLWHLNLESRREQQIQLPGGYTSLEQICAASHGIALIASGGSVPVRVITVPLLKEGEDQPVRIWQRASSEEIPESAYSQPQALRWQGMDGETVHGLLYAPHSERYEGIGKPPLMVIIHGGPTDQALAAFNSRTQFFTSRGYAVLEVNYRGSSGYGRPYRDALRGKWGIYDVQDAVSGARWLVEQGLVDGQRLVIMGGSAGGFTVLQALENYPGFFRAGICLYGISNQFTLAAETHKFEAHYSDVLLGELPEAAPVYRERSPIFAVDKIRDPLAVFQGEVDPVVPRKQADELVEALQRHGIPHVYHVYPGEGHGFRKAETIEHLYQTIDGFLRQFVIFA
ncbi:MAG: S9 family peptidase [Chloroflexota bacterium]